jgi:hypothetical protein
MIAVVHSQTFKSFRQFRHVPVAITLYCAASIFPSAPTANVERMPVILQVS